jgi:hypothetical protein
LTRGGLTRALVAGCAWGIAMGVGLAALSSWDCGIVCLSDAALTTVIASAAGILTIGPLAAFGRSHGRNT